MKLPRAINSPNLIETIIEVRIFPNPELDRALWAGILAPAMSAAGYKYQSIPQLCVVPEGVNSVKLTMDREEENSAITLFVNDDCGVRVLLNGPTVSFNCRKGKYIGWDNYFVKIAEVLGIIDSAKIALNYDRSMIRFISEYDFNILDHVDFEVNSHSDKRYNTREICLSRKDENAVAYISITDRRERFAPMGKESHFSSLFDVNVFEKLKENASLEDVHIALNHIHQIEKEAFFGLLKEDFIKTLNPV